MKIFSKKAEIPLKISKCPKGSVVVNLFVYDAESNKEGRELIEKQKEMGKRVSFMWHRTMLFITHIILWIFYKGYITSTFHNYMWEMEYLTNHLGGLTRAIIYSTLAE